MSACDATNIQGEEQAAMDVVANEIFFKHLKSRVAYLASEENEDMTVGSRDKGYEIAFDPLDGSSNLDASIATGSIFGIFPLDKSCPPFSRSGRSLVAAGYCLYSSSVELVVSFNGGRGVVGFTLDPSKKDEGTTDQAASFLLSRPSLQCPMHGTYYSLNDGREPDWPQGLSRWIHDAKRGLTPCGTKFSSRYVCSLVADVHRTIIKGGWAGNPRPHLRLLFEAAPLAFVIESSGGLGSDGLMNLLDIKPSSLHDRVSVFLGSKGDINELVAYGDVQQPPQTYKS